MSIYQMKTINLSTQDCFNSSNKILIIFQIKTIRVPKVPFRLFVKLKSGIQNLNV